MEKRRQKIENRGYYWSAGETTSKVRHRCVGVNEQIVDLGNALGVGWHAKRTRGDDKAPLLTILSQREITLN